MLEEIAQSICIKLINERQSGVGEKPKKGLKSGKFIKLPGNTNEIS